MARDRLTEIPVVFYRTAAGAEPVREWLRRLSIEDRKTIGTDLATLQVGWPNGSCDLNWCRDSSPMTSFRQIEANRRNASKSTGPLTEEGAPAATRSATA